MSVQIQLLTERFLPPPSPCWALGEAAKVMLAPGAEILSSVQSETHWDGENMSGLHHTWGHAIPQGLGAKSLA